MQHHKLITNLIVAIFAAGAAGNLFAHDFWIEPDVFTPAEDEPVSISLRQGVDFKGDSVPYIDDWFNDFSMTTSAGRGPVLSILGNDPAATIMAQPGAQLLGYQSVPVFVQLSAYKFNAYLEEEGIEFIRAERERLGETDKPAPENFIRCAKALIQTGPSGGDIYRQKLGYTLELIPRSDPYKLAPGDELEFEVLYRDEPIEGLQVQALNKASPELKQKVRTDENGRATVTIDTPGTWLVKVVQIIPVRGRPQTIPGAPPARWQSYWASFVFALPES
jgi:uncharacterized GH25 family protein